MDSHRVFHRQCGIENNEYEGKEKKIGGIRDYNNICERYFMYPKAKHTESWVGELPWVWGLPVNSKPSLCYRMTLCPNNNNKNKLKSWKRKREEITITYFRAVILKIKTGQINQVNIKYTFVQKGFSRASYLPQKSLLTNLSLGEVFANKFGGCSHCPLTNRTCTITMYKTPQLTSTNRTNPQTLSFYLNTHPTRRHCMVCTKPPWKRN